MKSSVSVVIPLYNKKLYIGRTLDSVLSQTFTDFECIIVDSSNDGSTEVVQTYTDPRIHHIIREQRTYLPIARNIGVELASSDLIAFVDADDEWTLDHLGSLVELSVKYPHAGVYTTPYIKLRLDSTPMVMIFAGIPKPPWDGYITRYFQVCLRGDVPICSSSCAIQKQVFKSLNGFNEQLIIAGEDQEMWGRIALQYPIAFTWKGSSIYHTEATGRMCNDPQKLLITPVSQYLQEQLQAGKVNPKYIRDVKAYIRRKEMKHRISRIFGSCNPDVSNSNNLNAHPLLTKSGRWFLTQLLQLYESKWHNLCRMFCCYLHGWHVPRLDD